MPTVTASIAGPCTYVYPRGELWNDSTLVKRRSTTLRDDIASAGIADVLLHAATRAREQRGLASLATEVELIAAAIVAAGLLPGKRRLLPRSHGRKWRGSES